MTLQNDINNFWSQLLALQKGYGMYQIGLLQNDEGNFTTKRGVQDQFQLQKNLPKPFYTVHVFSLFVVEIPTRMVLQ